MAGRTLLSHFKRKKKVETAPAQTKNEASKTNNGPPVKEGRPAQPLSPKELAERTQRLKAPFATNNLWEMAYGQLDPKITHQYEEYLLLDSHGSSEDRQQQLQRVVKERLETITNSRRKITIGEQQIVVRDQVLKIINRITQFQDIISAAVSAEPQASLAWGSVSVVLPVCTKRVYHF
jgi:N-terminal domain of NWD NACHT-NTPase